MRNRLGAIPVDRAAIAATFARHRFATVIHLAAQAGVRHSIDHPHVYAEANLDGFVRGADSLFAGIEAMMLAVDRIRHAPAA